MRKAACAAGWLCFLVGEGTFAGPNIAWHYGATPPFDELRSFEVVVVDPDHGFDPNAYKTARSELFAYVSVGETHPSRSYTNAMDRAWFIGENAAWGSRVMDQSQPAWQRFFVERIVAPLWDKGYRGFFFDGLDSYQLAARTDAARELQEDGLAAIIEAVNARYPEARVVLNRGFEVLPRVHRYVAAVAAESLFGGYDAQKRRYVKIKAADRKWLADQLKRIRNDYCLPVYAIDYAPPGERQWAEAIAAKIAALGIKPYVTDAYLMTLGITHISSEAGEELACAGAALDKSSFP